VYDVDTSWLDEMEYFIDSIQQNTEVLSGNSTDALKVMSLIDQIYETN
jgi:predicted dehydrogenase